MATKAIGTMNGIDREAVDRERRDVDVLTGCGRMGFGKSEVSAPSGGEVLGRPSRRSGRWV